MLVNRGLLTRAISQIDKSNEIKRADIRAHRTGTIYTSAITSSHDSLPNECRGFQPITIAENHVRQ